MTKQLFIPPTFLTDQPTTVIATDELPPDDAWLLDQPPTETDFAHPDTCEFCRHVSQPQSRSVTAEEVELVIQLTELSVHTFTLAQF